MLLWFVFFKNIFVVSMELSFVVSINLSFVVSVKACPSVDI